MATVRIIARATTAGLTVGDVCHVENEGEFADLIASGLFEVVAESAPIYSESAAGLVPAPIGEVLQPGPRLITLCRYCGLDLNDPANGSMPFHARGICVRLP